MVHQMYKDIYLLNIKIISRVHIYMYICPLDDHLLLTLGYDSVLLQSTSEIFFKQRNPYHTLLKKIRWIFCYYHFLQKRRIIFKISKVEVNLLVCQNYVPLPPFFFKVNQQFLLNIVRKYFSRLVFKRYILINTELLYLFLEINWIKKIFSQPSISEM